MNQLYKKPKISVLIPTYNQSKYIADAITSVQKQDYDNIEIIISDDCSNDDTRKVVKTFLNDKRVKYFRNKSNLGRVKNYNTLLYKYAKGDWVINLDGDDYFTDYSYLSEAIELIEKDSDIAFVFGDKYVFNENNNIQHIETNSALPAIMDGNFLFKIFPAKNIRMPHLSILYNRKKAIETGFYNQDIISTDWESFLRLMINNKAAYLKKPAGVWRYHTQNESKTTNLEKLLNNLKLINSVFNYVKAKNVFNANVLTKWKEAMEFRLLKAIISKLLVTDKFPTIIKFFIRAYKLYPKTTTRIILNPKTVIEIILSVYPPLLTKVYRIKGRRISF